MKKDPEHTVARLLWIAGVWICIFFVGLPSVQAAAPLIVDHNSTDIRQIPEEAIWQAKAALHIAYAHTSHGSQLISGMGSNNGVSFDTFMSANGSTPGLYLWNNGGTGGALDLHDGFVSGDLGNPDRETWAQRTRDYLDNPANQDVNVVIWSWCGQANTSIANIDIYLNLMEQLINDYPEVQFVFMTGHLAGTGTGGQLHLANEHIRNHCRENNRILYDFADIESFDPDGLVNYNELSADDACNYDSDGNGSRESNWALDWQASHTEGVDWWASGAAHSQHLNGNLKGYAAWWLWASLAGWNRDICLPQPGGLSAQFSMEPLQITLQWDDIVSEPGESGYIIQRRVDSGPWETDYAQVGPDVTTYADTAIVPGFYEYRVVGYLQGDDICLSSPSATVSVQYADTLPQDPSGLAASLSQNGISLSWQDNSGNEDGFEIEKATDRGPYYFLAWVDADVISFEDVDPAPLHSYSYRVRAVNGFGASDYSNEVLIDMPEQTRLTVLKQGVDGYAGCTDAYLDAATPQVNYGGTLYKNIGGAPLKRMIIKFELPESLLNKTIHEAKLIMLCWSVSNFQQSASFSLHQVNDVWDENTTTWENRDSMNAWSVPGGDFDTVPLVQVPIENSAYYPEFDITEMVQAWSRQSSANLGVMLVNDTAVITGIKGSEYSEYGRPSLEITWSSSSQECHPDDDADGDVDGADLATLVLNFNPVCLASFVEQFGQN